MTLIDDLQSTGQKVWDFVKRHSVWLAVGLAAILLLAPTISEINTILMACLFEALAIALSSIALYSYTNIKLTKTLIKGEDGEFNSTEQHGYYTVIGLVFLGVHLLVGLIVFGTYFIQYSR